MLLYLKTVTDKPLAKDQAFELIVSFMAGGVHALLVEWVSQGTPFTAQQMGIFLDALSASHEDVTIV